MSAQSPQFDSHRFVKRLTAAGLSEEVAEILADEHTRRIVPGDVATKADVETVATDLDRVATDLDRVATDLDRVATKLDRVATKLDRVATKLDRVATDLDTVKGEMATKADLRREIAASEARMEQRLQNAILEAKVSLIQWMIATMAVFSGIVIGAMTALQ